MRHGIKGRKLSRTSAHRKVTMQSLAMALIRERRITTTLAKAKELRGFVEPLITRAKEDTHHNRRQVFSSLQNKEAVTTLFTEVGPKCKDRPGGYTRVIKAGFRKGDGAEIAIIELVDYNDIKPEGSSPASSGKKKTRRAGKSNTPTSTEEDTPKKEEATNEAEVNEDASADVAEVEEEETETSEDNPEEEKK